jgi:nucleotide-binding universal stress UspA family protein
MVLFAYDGTIHGDWVAHYAVRLASHAPQRLLRLVHVDEGRWSPAELEEKLERLERFAERFELAVQFKILPNRSDVFGTLVQDASEFGDPPVICGVRARARRRGLLAGTVSQRLLCETRIPVLALRVVQPGLLGAPRNLLFPISSHARGIAAALPFIALLVPDVARIHILYVQQVGRFRFRQLSYEKALRLRHVGRKICQQVESELRRTLALERPQMDATAVVSDDPPKEIVIQANRTRSRLILIGASADHLTGRFWYGDPLEQVLRDSGCDVAIYRDAR